MPASFFGIIGNIYGKCILFAPRKHKTDKNMKASVYLKEAKGYGKQGVSCICFRLRDKEIDIKVASMLQVVDKYWDGNALRYRRNTIVDKNEQKRIPEQIAAIIEQIETSFDRNKADWAG